MEIIKFESNIEQWHTRGECKSGLFKTHESPAFQLVPHHPVNKSILHVLTDIQFKDSTPDDFTLKIKMSSMTQFDCAGNPTIDDLYEVFLLQRERIHAAILERLEDEEHYIHHSRPDIKESDVRKKLGETLAMCYLA